MIRRAAIGAALIVGVGAGSAGGAQARSIAAAFEIPTVPGQQVGVQANDGRASITVSTSDPAARRYEAASYDARATLGRRWLSVDLGRFGSVRMRFRPSEPPFAGYFGDCRFKEYRGHFDGEASYAGEGLAAAASATRARGRVYFVKGSGCHVVAGRQEPDRSPQATVLELLQRPGDENVLAQTFSAIKWRRGPAEFAARRISTEGRVLINHYVHAEALRSSFTFDRSLTQASVTPSAPFAGSGAFMRTAGRGGFSGDLGYGPFGLPPFPFAAGTMRATLRRASAYEILHHRRGAPAQLARYAGK